MSPDGKWALATQAVSETSRFVLLTTGAGEEKTLAIGSLVFNRFTDWAAFHPDGRSIFFSAREPGHRVRAYRLSLEGGAPRAVSEEGTRPFLISRDGAFLLARIQGNDEVGLFATNGSDAKPFRVTRLPERYTPIHWSADGKSILIGEESTRPHRVDRLDLATGERKPWRTFSSTGRTGAGGLAALIVSADEDGWVAFYHRLFSHLVVVDGLR